MLQTTIRVVLAHSMILAAQFPEKPLVSGETLKHSKLDVTSNAVDNGKTIYSSIALQA